MVRKIIWALIIASSLAAGPEAAARKWKNGFWLNGFWLNGFWLNGSALNGKQDGGNNRYLLGEAALNHTEVDGVSLPGMTKDRVPLVGVRLDGSQLVGFTKVKSCEKAAAQERCFASGDAFYRKHEGAWFEGAIISGTVVPATLDETPICSDYKIQSIHRSCRKTGEAGGSQQNCGPLPVTMKIVGHRRRHDDVDAYLVRIEDDKGPRKGVHGEKTSPYICGTGEHGPVWAIPLQGRWNPFPKQDHGGAHISADANVITFACENTALGECAGDLGYKPWARSYARSLPSPAYPAVVPSWIVEEGAALHQACSRMIRADYCGDGRSHTVTGTRIDLYDGQKINELDPSTLASFKRKFRHERNDAELPASDATGPIADKWEGVWDEEGIVVLDWLRWRNLHGVQNIRKCAEAREGPQDGASADDFVFPGLTKSLTHWAPGYRGSLADFHVTTCPGVDLSKVLQITESSVEP
jgi:hypothetical protein